MSELEDLDRKAELILVKHCNDLPTEEACRLFCEELGVPWDEYIYLRNKYREVLKIYNAQSSEDRRSGKDRRAT